MLDAIARKREAKAQQKAYELYLKGCTQLDGKLYKQAMIEFQQALKIDPKTIPTQLENALESYASSGDHDSALSIGLVLIKVQPTNYKLANMLGNCARKNRNYKQANNLYRHALKVNKKYELAFYNLAASMGKVDKFDDDVKSSLERFKEMDEYILPDYCNNPGVVAELTEILTEENKKKNVERIQELTTEKELKEIANEIVIAKSLAMEIKELQTKVPEPTPSEILQELISSAREPMGLAVSEEAKNKYHGELFNVILYALGNKQLEIAKKYVTRLQSLETKIDYFEMATAILMMSEGEKEKAIEVMVRLLGDDPYNRYYNVNLGLMYRKTGNRLLCLKYLAIAASLLEKSDGLYRRSEILQAADKHYMSGAHKKAVVLYQVVVSEQDDLQAWDRLGECYLQMNRHEDAAYAYKEIQRIDPDSPIAKEKLMSIHDFFFNRGEEFFTGSKYRAAIGMFEKALSILRLAETIKRAAGVYKVLKNQDKHNEYMDEYEEIKNREKEIEQEKVRQEYILRGKIFMKRKNFPRAIENFELAFRMKLDKDVFMYLASLFKALKKNEEMRDLLDRWNKMVEYDEKMKKFQKTVARGEASSA